MKRTINLYHPSLQPQKERLPLAKVLWVNGVAFAVMLTAVVLLNVTLSGKQETLKHQTAAVSQINDEIKALTAALEKKRDTKNLQQQLARVNTKIENRKQLLAYLESGELSFDATKCPFSNRFGIPFWQPFGSNNVKQITQYIKNKFNNQCEN